ncbi:hypothetical protein AXG93_2423s1070 [Marchantia polymorpha subsp. ruderalis]|uniref:Cytochrome b5 heme-binding domain-containing protein n=1 Tax=Marchantia polymorpha subsp. ruderalis TaxID=1480154 RepID=A0A176VNN5_MARPO|nr:hypothetical protein AXG93_2423s1070 [Marchantia polymorpha subsp. ruderalis]
MVELVLLDEGGVAGPGAGRSQVESMSIEKYTVEEVATHSSADDCWVIIHGKIYDVTKYLDDHPGGDQVLLVSAGEDATEEFDDAGHSTDAWKLMEKYVVGQETTDLSALILLERMLMLPFKNSRLK